MRNTRYVLTMCALLMALIVSLGLSACGSSDPDNGGGSTTTTPITTNTPTTTAHTHSFSLWGTTTAPSCIAPGMQTRTCSCGFSEYSQIPALGHTEVVDPAVSPTCFTAGKTQGSHCGVCGATIVAQSVIASEGHQYDTGTIVASATCIQEGIKKFTCTVVDCKHSYTETYSLPAFTATEIYNQSVQYVGEIVVYDRQGAELGLGTCFVYSADGKIVTNYHVIDEAYSAKITLNDATYPVQSVLAYDETIDLAVLKINAAGLTAAPICRKPVQAGETVYAIGSSRGLTNTYSQGIITYADRIMDGVSHVQHDASITHGNSGGPLINVYGEVIGINTWGLSDSQNLNFAVFADELDNLVYGAPISLSELYAQNHGPYYILLDWVLDNYTYCSDEGDYFLYEDEYDDGSAYGIAYTPMDADLLIDVLWYFDDGATLYMSMRFLPDSYRYQYYAHYEAEGTDNYTRGWINAGTFTEDTTLTYDSCEGGNWNRTTLLNFYSAAMIDLVGWFGWCAEDCGIGVSIEDFGFTAFQ